LTLALARRVRRPPVCSSSTVGMAAGAWNGTELPLTEPDVLLDSARLVGGVEAGTRSEKVSSSKVWATWIVEGAEESTEGARLIVAASSRAMELLLRMLHVRVGVGGKVVSLCFEPTRGRDYITRRRWRGESGRVVATPGRYGTRKILSGRVKTKQQ
jgi:hypothetical protein